ncbi:MAG: ABC transporter substrate-binding protein [Dongiaceae bacterium]
MTKNIWSSRRRFLRQTSLAIGATATGTFLSLGSGPRASSNIVLAGWGGEAQRRLTEAVSKPFTSETGIGVTDVVAVTTMVSQIKAQVDNDNPEWDVAVLTGPEAFQLAEGGYLAELTYESEVQQEIPAELIGKYCAAQFYAMFVVGWNPEIFPDSSAPQTWADFWNVERFPGRRTACGWFPYYMVEIALMADGLPKDQVYPMTTEKIEHAFGKIKELRPHIDVWWGSGAQSAQLFVDKEVDLGMLYTSRLREVVAAGHPAKWSIAQPLLEAQWLAIPKSSRNVEAAAKWINVALRKDAQAKMMRLNSAPPTNPAAFDLLTPEEKASGLGDQDAVRNGLLLDSDYWWREYPKYLEAWEAIKAG